MILVYVKSGCPHCEALIGRLEAEGKSPVLIDVETERRVIPELIKLTGGKRIVPVLVEGTEIRVAPEGGTEF